jgi:hypothetical protein
MAQSIGDTLRLCSCSTSFSPLAREFAVDMPSHASRAGKGLVAFQSSRMACITGNAVSLSSTLGAGGGFISIFLRVIGYEVFGVGLIHGFGALTCDCHEFTLETQSSNRHSSHPI